MRTKQALLWGILSVFLFLPPNGFSTEASLAVKRTDKGTAVELAAESGEVFAVFGPFADNQVQEENGTVSITTEGVTTTLKAGNPFFSLTFSAKAESDSVLKEFNSPKAFLTIRNKEEICAADSLKVLGTMGLTAVDAHPGSYAFLAAADPQTNSGVVAGWETSRVGSGILFSEKTENNEVLLSAKIEYGAKPLKAGEEFTSETLLIGSFTDVRLGLEQYADAVAAANNVKIKPPRAGYCTWYSDLYAGCGSETTTAEFAAAAGEKLVPYGMDYFQIDHGWQMGNSANGLHKNFTNVRPDGGYRSGIPVTAANLAVNGLDCGLWIVPFNGDAHDPWFADKMDLFVKSAIDYPPPGEPNTRIFSSVNQVKGAPYEAYWAGHCLDMTRPETIAFVESNIRRMVEEWGVKYIKADALWCGMAIEELYVNDGYHPDDIGNQIFFDSGKTNVEAFCAGMTALRRAAQDTYLLGCVASQNMRMMLSSAGFVDSMRIGPDNGANWQGICDGPIRATNRYFWNGRVWWNDPDPVYARDSLPLNQARTITSWGALAGQHFAFSDWLPNLSPERVNLLRKTMPPHGRTTVRPIDLFTEKLARIWTLSNASETTAPEEMRFVCGFFNWNENEPARFELTPEKLETLVCGPNGEKPVDYAVYDFWGEAFYPCFKTDAGIFSVDVPPADCKILAVRPVFKKSAPMLVSTSRNVSQGIYEIISENWNSESRTLTITIDPKKAALAEELLYEIRIFAPNGTVPAAVCNGEELSVQPLGTGQLAVAVNPDRSRFTGRTEPVTVELTFPEP